MDGYCMKCRHSRAMPDTEQMTMKNGRHATRGACTVYGAKLVQIGSSAPKEVEAWPSALAGDEP